MMYSMGARKVRLCKQLEGILSLFQELNDEPAAWHVVAVPSLLAGETDTENWVLCATWAGGTKEVTIQKIKS